MVESLPVLARLARHKTDPVELCSRVHVSSFSKATPSWVRAPRLRSFATATRLWAASEVSAVFSVRRAVSSTSGASSPVGSATSNATRSRMTLWETYQCSTIRVLVVSTASRGMNTLRAAVTSMNPTSDKATDDSPPRASGRPCIPNSSRAAPTRRRYTFARSTWAFGLSGIVS